MKMHPMWMPKYGWRGCLRALVHSLDPKMATERIRTFQSIAEKVFLPAIRRILEPVLWLDVIWDRYLEISLKTQAREEHGSGALMKVDKDVGLPASWQNILRSAQNKDSAFKLLANIIALNVWKHINLFSRPSKYLELTLTSRNFDSKSVKALLYIKY